MKKKLYQIARKVFRFFVVIKKDMEGKEYRIRHTPFSIRVPYQKIYEKKWGSLPIIKNRIVVDNYMGKGYGCNGKYVTEELLLDREKYDIIWVVDDIRKKKDQFPEGIRLVQHLSKEACEAYATAGIWLCNYHMVPYINVNVLKRPEQTYIQMWHGSLGIKKIEADSPVVAQKTNWLSMAKVNAKITDYWISNSDFETKVFHDAFWGAGPTLKYGHARNDIFFHDTEKYQKRVRDNLKISPEEKIVLYVPTHRDTVTKKEMESLDYAMVKEALEEKFGGSWQVVVRPHPRDAEKMSGEASELVKLAGDYPDVQELLVTAEAVITDYSSCIFDFMLTKRPGFFFVTDSEEYTEMRGLYYPLTDTPFPVAYSNQDLREKIAAFDPEHYQVCVEEFLKGKGCMEDGHAAKRIKDLIDQIIEGKDKHLKAESL